jgi:nucleoside-diphosphate-sugar epimerase
MTSVLVTGGAGYIGSVLVPDLLAQGYHVTVVDNFMYQQTSLANCIRHKNFRLIYGDVRDKFMMKREMANADVLIPLAAIVGAPACDKDPFLAKSVNLDATLWLINNSSSNQQVVMPTTNSAYGGGERENFCDENSPLHPLSSYAKDKVVVEEALMQLENATSLRLATVFGLSLRMRLDLLVNNFVYRAISDGFLMVFEGHFKRNYVHVLDVVQAFNLALNNQDLFRSHIFNVGLSEANVSKIQLCDEIKKVIPSFTYLEAPFGKDPDQRNYVVSNSKIESLGFTPSVSLRDGIEELSRGLPMYLSRPYTNL